MFYLLVKMIIGLDSSLRDVLLVLKMIIRIYHEYFHIDYENQCDFLVSNDDSHKSGIVFLMKHLLSYIRIQYFSDPKMSRVPIVLCFVNCTKLASSLGHEILYKISGCEGFLDSATCSTSTTRTVCTPILHPILITFIVVEKCKMFPCRLSYYNE